MVLVSFYIYIYKYIFFLVTYVLSFSFFLPFFFSFDLTGSIGKKCIAGYPFLFPFFFFALTGYLIICAMWG